MLKFLVFALALAVVVFADEEDCTLNGITIKKGESASGPIGKCELITCHGKGSISGKTCAAFVPAPNCKRSDYDYTKPYPACCPKQVC